MVQLPHHTWFLQSTKQPKQHSKKKRLIIIWYHICHWYIKGDPKNWWTNEEESEKKHKDSVKEGLKTDLERFSYKTDDSMDILNNGSESLSIFLKWNQR